MAREPQDDPQVWSQEPPVEAAPSNGQRIPDPRGAQPHSPLPELDPAERERQARLVQQRAIMSRSDIYSRPMRAGKPAPSGVISRRWGSLKYSLASEARRREWAVDEQLLAAEPLSRPNTISVISPKGGVGKTTISFVLGNLLASQLRLRVIAIDANPDFGTLSSLADDDRRSTRSLGDLLADHDQISSPAELHPYVSRLGTGLHLLGAPADAEVMAQMTPGLYGRLLDVLEHYYEVLILDLGTGITDPIAQFAVQRADQSVVITTPEWITSAGVLGALRYLQLEEGTLVLNQATTRRGGAARRVIEETFARYAVATRATIPYDQQLRLMLDTGTYTLDTLKRSTRVPIKELGAAIARNFV